MAEHSLFGDGLVLAQSLPLTWKPGALPEGPALARLNSEDHQLLGAEASLEEARVHEALKDESPALVHELQRLEFKLNLLLRLTSEIAMQHNALPPLSAVRLAARGLEWLGPDAPVVGSTGVLELFINPALPQALKLPCRVLSEQPNGEGRTVQLRFEGLGEPVIELIDKLIFRHHRRLVAGSRQASA